RLPVVFSPLARLPSEKCGEALLRQARISRLSLRSLASHFFCCSLRRASLTSTTRVLLAKPLPGSQIVWLYTVLSECAASSQSS
ncbi:hypothetical protein CSUI_011549, partial [Cystoisospora suis]